MEFKHAVFVGRFQPFHSGHLEVIKHGLEIAEQVIVVIGSAHAAPSPKNPWTGYQRWKMIADHFGITLTDAHKNRVKIVQVRDYFYNLDAWLMDVQAKTGRYISEGDSVALLGQFKDASTYYLKLFPQWEHVPRLITHSKVSGTDIRRDLFYGVTDRRDWQGKVPEEHRRSGLRLPVPPVVEKFLEAYVSTKEYADLCKEWDFIEGYKQQWASAPFPPVFVTTDACVTTSGHVLVVVRKTNPGKGLYALPGGFLKTNELVQDGMLRELREETGIKVPKPSLETAIVNSRVFDHPDRSLRGRTISHGFHLRLRDGDLPDVRGGDDAASAFWMPLWDVTKQEDEFFEDHASIIAYFTSAPAVR